MWADLVSVSLEGGIAREWNSYTASRLGSVDSLETLSPVLPRTVISAGMLYPEQSAQQFLTKHITAVKQNILLILLCYYCSETKENYVQTY